MCLRSRYPTWRWAEQTASTKQRFLAANAGRPRSHLTSSFKPPLNSGETSRPVRYKAANSAVRVVTFEAASADGKVRRMQHHILDSDPINAATLVARARSTDHFSFSQAALDRLAADRKVVEAYAASGDPVYGLNTGLGGNLAYRLDAVEVLAFQAHQDDAQARAVRVRAGQRYRRL